jgi:diguanylate cyclase (GGDEF)-like protein
MYKPSWPAPVRPLRPAPSLRVRRHVDAALRLTLRRSVALGAGAFSGAGVVASVVWAVGPATVSRSMAVILGVAILLPLLVLYLAARRRGRPELLAMALALTGCGLVLGQAWLHAELTTMSVVYMSTVLVAVGLIFAWSTAWHASFLALAAGSATALYLLTGSQPRSVESVFIILALASGAFTSLVGHRIWHQRLRQMFGQQFELRWLSREAARQEARVRTLNRDLHRMAHLDPLTEVGNRRALDEAIAGLVAPDRRGPPCFSLALFDIDSFKAYNDRHGHLAGDRALELLGDILRGETRGPDLVFRYGGEEFVVLLPGTGFHGAIATAERIRHAVGAEPVDVRGTPVPVSGDEIRTGPEELAVTCSAGVAAFPGHGRTIAALLRSADAAMYSAKQLGRNRVVGAQGGSVGEDSREVSG